MPGWFNGPKKLLCSISSWFLAVPSNVNVAVSYESAGGGGRWCGVSATVVSTPHCSSGHTIGGNNREPDTTTTVMTAFTDDGGVAFKDAIIEALAWMDES